MKRFQMASDDDEIMVTRPTTWRLISVTTMTTDTCANCGAPADHDLTELDENWDAAPDHRCCECLNALQPGHPCSCEVAR